MKFPTKFKTYKEVPEWARFLTLDEFRHFLGTVERDLQNRRMFFADHDGVLRIPVDGGTLQCGLYNIALKCGTMKTTEYAGEVKAHFDRVFKGYEPKPGPLPKSFDEVREYVRVRLYTNEFVAQSKAEVISRQITPDLQALVVYDFEAAAASMSPEQAQHWNLSTGEVFRIALENTTKLPWSRSRFELLGGEAFVLLNTDGYAVSHVFALEKHVPALPYGALVAMPCRQILVCYPIVPATVMDALTELTMRVDAMYKDPPGGGRNHVLSSDLYWWRPGAEALESMGAGVNRLGLKGCVVAPPQEFVDTVMVEATKWAAAQPSVNEPNVANGTRRPARRRSAHGRR